MNPIFWQHKRVFITGHTGFKGSWLSLWLQSMGCEVAGYALAAPTQPSLFENARVSAGMQSTIADIRDLAKLTKAMQSFQPDVVFHMAAQALVRYSYENPVETYSTNVMGTVNLFEAARATASVRAIVNITTDKCYENREWIWGYREFDPMGGHDPYSSSKACAELLTSAYRSSFFAPSQEKKQRVALASARAGNVIGGGDWAQDRLIPDIISAFEKGTPVSIRAPRAIRPWQHVLEPLRGYLMLAERLVEDGTAYAEGWNFGPSDEDARPVLWIVEKLADMWGSGAHWNLDEREHPHEASHLKLDISKARSRLNWQPHTRLEHALRMIVSWNKQRIEGADIRDITLRQIADYQLLGR